MDLRISARRITKLLVFVTVLAVAISFLGQFYKEYLSPDPYLLRLARLFDVKKEESAITWYSEVLLLICSALFAVIFFSKRRSEDRYSWHWLGLSVIFLFMSLDEGASIHETLGGTGRFMLGVLGVKATGFLSYTWIVPVAILVVIFLLAYLRFFFDLPPRQRLLFLLAGTLYVGGAMIMEAISASYISLFGTQNAMTVPQFAFFHATSSAQEALEMLGAVALIYALLSYISGHEGDVRLRFGDKAPVEERETERSG